MNGLDYAAICEALAALPQESRRRIVEHAATRGYAAKDLAELMGVSPPAVSRYLHGTLAPSTGAICRLLMSIDEDTRLELLLLAAREIWRLLGALLDQLPQGPEVEKLLTEIADTLSEKLAAYHLGARREEY